MRLIGFGLMRVAGYRRNLLLSGLAVSIAWAQVGDPGPQLLIRVPNGISFASAEVAFSVNSGHLYTYRPPHTVKMPSDTSGKVVFQQYVIDANVGGFAADRVRAVMLIPGCETQRLDVAVHHKNEAVDAKCVRVPVAKFMGRIAENELTETRWLKVNAAYRSKWVPKFLGAERIGADRQPPEAAEFDIVSATVSKDRSFVIEVPNLVHDPGELSAVAEDRGELLLTLLDTSAKVPVVLGTLRPDKFSTESGGLELRTEYPELRFVLER